ncbi:facilitated trehalose transporter Tret1-like [Contarinia nasturtii]|uniref:facilitated trehalose transporter Tret1-like n=1 Tax=Contarinia nasturtii TaxID=265458 RepID=UPI0012D40596|nr:facilitated trehalose transporter Tret1-like [Contarinia nasturtii]
MCKMTPVLRQFSAIFICNLLTLAFGIQSGWAMINFSELQNKNSTFSTGPLTLDEVTLVVSLVNIGGFFGNFAIMSVSKWCGIKRTIHLFGLPLIISALLTIYANNVFLLYASSILSGIVGGALVIGIPSFINEICNDNVRGFLNSIYDPGYNLGVIISFFIGNYLSCLNQAKIQLIVPIIFMIAMFLLPDSPEYWQKRQKEKHALKAHTFYKGSTVNTHIPEHDEFIPKMKNETVEKGKLEEMANNQNMENSTLSLGDFCTPQARKTFSIAFTILLLSITSGTWTMLAYVTDIFEKTGSSLSSKNSSLLISITQIFANVLLLNVIERINRRTLYIWSSILTATSFFAFSIYCLLWMGQPKYEWMPPFCFSCIIFFSCLGLFPIPYILPTEIFQKNIRHTCLVVVVSVIWILSFCYGLVFPSFLEYVDLHFCFIFLGIISLVNAIFGYFFVPETRGKSYEEIMQLLSD